MRKTLFAFTILLMVAGCKNEEKKETTGSANDADMNALYEKHLAIVKSNLDAFANKNLDASFANVADTVRWTSPVYGDTVTTKAHWRESLKYWTDNFDSLQLRNPIYLPGVDQQTNKPDGSVRYYGVWEAKHKATGTHTAVRVYEFFNFNSDHKISADGSYFDVGGLMNAVTPKAK